VISTRSRVPVELLGIWGFFEWNRFCDRLDQGLQALRDLLEQHNGITTTTTTRRIDPGQLEQAKTQALQVFQTVCDRVSEIYPRLQFTLFCPFDTEYEEESSTCLVSNWHIQVIVLPPTDNDSAAHETAERILVDATERTDQQETSDTTPTEINQNVATSAGAPRLVEDEESETVDLNGSNTATTSHHQDHDTTAQSTPNSKLPAAGSSSYNSDERKRSGVLGVDYLEHRVQPHDTLQGLCLKYNVSAARIQQANLIMTHSQTSDALLLAAPELLAIPIVSRRPAAAGTTARDAAESVANGDPNEAAETGEDNAATTGTVGFYGRGSAKEDVEFYKIKTLQKEFKLGIKEAKAYLELANGVLEEARDAAREDIAWERQAQKDHF